MARDINRRLSSLKTRRSGTDRVGRIAMDAAADELAKRYVTEKYEQLADGQPYTRYALGSMQEAEPHGDPDAGRRRSDRIRQRARRAYGRYPLLMAHLP